MSELCSALKAPIICSSSRPRFSLPWLKAILMHEVSLLVCVNKVPIDVVKIYIFQICCPGQQFMTQKNAGHLGYLDSSLSLFFAM